MPKLGSTYIPPGLGEDSCDLASPFLHPFSSSPDSALYLWPWPHWASTPAHQGSDRHSVTNNTHRRLISITSDVYRLQDASLKFGGIHHLDLRVPSDSTNFQILFNKGMANGNNNTPLRTWEMYDFFLQSDELLCSKEHTDIFWEHSTHRSWVIGHLEALLSTGLGFELHKPSTWICTELLYLSLHVHNNIE